MQQQRVRNTFLQQPGGSMQMGEGQFALGAPLPQNPQAQQQNTITINSTTKENEIECGHSSAIAEVDCLYDGFEFLYNEMLFQFGLPDQQSFIFTG